MSLVSLCKGCIYKVKEYPLKAAALPRSLKKCEKNEDVLG